MEGDMYMKIEKKVIDHLNKCYSMAPLTWKGEDCLLVAAEKQDPCYLYTRDGKKLDTIWEKPGGVMTMQQIPGTDGEFLATQKFYSPNDSKEAFIAHVKPGPDGWEVKKLMDLPFVHRFAIIDTPHTRYLFACALKTGHECKEDWSSPGAVYVADLGEENPVPEVIATGLLRNHGFSMYEGKPVVGTENGTFLFTPPAEKGGEWKQQLLLPVPSSDSVLIDLDGDGKPELGSIAPFHGNGVTIWHLDQDGNYVPQWKLNLPEKDTEMVHGTWAGMLAGEPVWCVGWRKGTRATIAIRWDDAAGTYVTEEIDREAGAANLMHFVNEEGRDVLMATNREINEIAMYTITKED